MPTDLRPRRVHLPVIPSAKVIRQRLQELQAEARQLNILLRVASELEQESAPTPADGQGVDRG